MRGCPLKTTSLTLILVGTAIAILVLPVEFCGAELRKQNHNPAEKVDPDVKTVVQANSDLAMALYAQLARENAGKNLFFSPYSMSVALAMTVEGARGKTSREMGKVLGYPATLRGTDPGAQPMPWEVMMPRIHSGYSRLTSRLTNEKSPAEIASDRVRIDRFCKQLKELQTQIKQLQQAGKYRESSRLQGKERQAATELSAARAGVDQYELKIANALYGEKTYPFMDSYTQTIDKYYRTGAIRQADFKNNYPTERTRINQWVEEQTANRIKDLLPNLSPDQAKLLRLVLVNAIYFKGQWSVPFDQARTKNLPFSLPDGKSVQTPIMNARALKVAKYAAFDADGSAFDTPRRIKPSQKTGLYPDDDGFAMVELPYKGEDLSMVVIAPNTADRLGAIEKKLTAWHLSAWIGKLQKRKTHVLLPKFKLETDYQMGETLQAMGMVRAFTDPALPNGANFSGMSASKDPLDKLYIGKVIHKAFVEVNEKGTEAAAATAVMMVDRAAMPMDVPFTPTFRADRPFIFLIRDVQTGAVLFLGRMTNPK